MIINTLNKSYYYFFFFLYSTQTSFIQNLTPFSAKLHPHHADNPNGLIERGKRRKAIIKQAEETAVAEEEKEETPIPLLSVVSAEEERR